MPDLRPLNSIAELQPGDTIRNVCGSDALLVTSVYGDRATAVRTADVTNPSEWLHLPAGPPAQEEGPGEPDRTVATTSLDLAGLLVNLAYSVRDGEPGAAAESAREIADILAEHVPSLAGPSPAQHGGQCRYCDNPATLCAEHRAVDRSAVKVLLEAIDAYAEACGGDPTMATKDERTVLVEAVEAASGPPAPAPVAPPEAPLADPCLYCDDGEGEHDDDECAECGGSGQAPPEPQGREGEGSGPHEVEDFTERRRAGSASLYPRNFAVTRPGHGWVCWCSLEKDAERIASALNRKEGEPDADLFRQYTTVLGSLLHMFDLHGDIPEAGNRLIEKVHSLIREVHAARERDGHSGDATSYKAGDDPETEGERREAVARETERQQGGGRWEPIDTPYRGTWRRWVGQQEGETDSPPTAAHVIHKERHGGGRDGESWYAVLPVRATQEEALADLARWEGQQEGEHPEPVAEGEQPFRVEREREDAGAYLVKAWTGEACEGHLSETMAEISKDRLNRLFAARTSAMREEAGNRRPGDHLPTIKRHADGGFVWTNCKSCGPDVQVDEDGCCQPCGRDALEYGNEESAPSALPVEPLSEERIARLPNLTTECVKDCWKCDSTYVGELYGSSEEVCPACAAAEILCAEGGEVRP